jgi:hypothetical protein
MFNAFGIIFGIMLVAFVIALLDWLSRRKDRQSRKSTS